MGSAVAVAARRAREAEIAEQAAVIRRRELEERGGTRAAALAEVLDEPGEPPDRAWGEAPAAS